MISHTLIKTHIFFTLYIKKKSLSPRSFQQRGKNIFFLFLPPGHTLRGKKSNCTNYRKILLSCQHATYNDVITMPSGHDWSEGGSRGLAYRSLKHRQETHHMKRRTLWITLKRSQKGRVSHDYSWKFNLMMEKGFNLGLFHFKMGQEPYYCGCNEKKIASEWRKHTRGLTSSK